MEKLFLTILAVIFLNVGDYLFEPPENKWYYLIIHWILYIAPFTCLFGIKQPFGGPLLWLVLIPHIIIDLLESIDAVCHVVGLIYKLLLLILYGLCIWCYM